MTSLVGELAAVEARMSAIPPVATDAPSLTLPDWRTALKRRIRKPKMPPGWKLYLLIFVTNVGAALLNTLGLIAEVSLWRIAVIIAELLCVAGGWRGMRVGLGDQIVTGRILLSVPFLLTAAAAAAAGI